MGLATGKSLLSRLLQLLPASNLYAWVQTWDLGLSLSGWSLSSYATALSDFAACWLLFRSRLSLVCRNHKKRGYRFLRTLGQPKLFSRLHQYVLLNLREFVCIPTWIISLSLPRRWLCAIFWFFNPSCKSPFGFHKSQTRHHAQNHRGQALKTR